MISCICGSGAPSRPPSGRGSHNTRPSQPAPRPGNKELIITRTNVFFSFWGGGGWEPVFSPLHAIVSWDHSLPEPLSRGLQHACPLGGPEGPRVSPPAGPGKALTKWVHRSRMRRTGVLKVPVSWISFSKSNSLSFSRHLVIITVSLNPRITRDRDITYSL